MKNCFFLEKERAGLLIIDVQEKLFPQVDHSPEVLVGILKCLQGCLKMGLPIVVSEQYPNGLGRTIPHLKQCLPEKQKYWEKTTFSCFCDEKLKGYFLSLPVDQWILVGIEAHVCVMQTAKDLVLAGKEVVVANDAISSRSVYDFSTAISEMKDWARIASTESVLFELIRDASSPDFKQCLELFKAAPRSCGC
ncbi:MAG: hypothetical protein K940chlam3_01210 [Chlamydiae bacterium]|nr:hypothetical protein [Chlamydiota bacterium]